jgi:hypothetical protein
MARAPAGLPDRIRCPVEADYELVQTQRIDTGGPRLQRAGGAGFYKLINGLGETRIARGAADFPLRSRAAPAILVAAEQSRGFRRMALRKGEP